MSRLVISLGASTDSDKKDKHKATAMIRPGTLRDLLSSARSDSPVALNVLDLPLGNAPVPIPPMYNDIATDARTRNTVKRLVDLDDMRNVTSWGTAATTNAFSWGHIDDDGFGTAVSVQTGGKWWVLARKKDPNALADEMSTGKTFDDWSPEDVAEDTWDLEAVHLDRTCIL